MGFLSQLSSVRAAEDVPRRGASDVADFWYDPYGWVSTMALAGGIGISPELALTLSYVQCAVQTISDDVGSMTCQLFADLGDGAHRRVKYSDPGIGGLAYRLRWQPNRWQSAKAFWSTLVWQYLLRPAAYAEVIYRPGLDSVIDAIIPRHPDRVEQQTLPNGHLRFKLTEPIGPPRYVVEDEMFVVRNTSADGLNAIGRTVYGGKALATGLALQDFTRNFFRKGATAALVATYKGGDMEDEEEQSLHQSIMRYIAGPENAGGVLLVKEDIDVKSLGVDPEKAQLLGLKDLSGRDVARMFKMPPHKLGISGTQTYASQVQSAQEYVSGTLMPIVVEFEQGIYIHLITARDYFAKFNMDVLVRADLLTRMQAYAIGIRSRILRPSEARVREDLNPDPALDRLSEQDFRPGAATGGRDLGEGTAARAGLGGAVKMTLMAYDNAQRVVRRERVVVEKIARRHPSDVERWHVELRDFYAEHAAFVSDVMRLPAGLAQAYAAEHRAAIEQGGVVVMDDQWARQQAETLTLMACAEDDVPADPIRLRVVTPPQMTTVTVAPAAAPQTTVNITQPPAVRPTAKRKFISFDRHESTGLLRGGIIEETEVGDGDGTEEN